MDSQVHLRRLARLAHVAHGLTLLQMLAGVGVLLAIQEDDHGTVRSVAGWVSTGLATIVLCVVSVAAIVAARAGLGRAAARFAGALLLWGSAVLAAQLGGGSVARSFAAPPAMAIDLALIAWCALLGGAVKAAGTPGVGLFRGLAYASMALHIAVQLAPLPLMSTLGPLWVGAIAIGSTALAWGAATADAISLDRALPDAEPELPALAELDARARDDDPWRPGA